MRVFEFGKRREVMADNQEPNKEPVSKAQVSQKQVELFPVQLHDRRLPVQYQAAAGGGRTNGPQISIFNPSTFEDAVDIVECLRGRAATTISLDSMKKGDASRLIDFVTGASAALDGNFHKLTDQVYVFCPSNIKIIAPTILPGTKSGAGALDFLFSSEILSGSAPAARSN
jgi:FtsZ-interacting cell division protein YlmF